MGIDAFEEREKMLNHRAAILEAEWAYLSGEPTCSLEDAKKHLKEKYYNG